LLVQRRHPLPGPVPVVAQILQVALGSPDPADRPEPVRRQREKQAIARAAARLVRPGEAIGILAGSTTGLLARELLRIPGLTVVSNSIGVADVFHAGGPADRTVLLIGRTRTRSDALVGPVAQHTAAGINLDVVHLGVHGMTVGAGFTLPSQAEARTVALLIRAARRVVVLATTPRRG
jgi:DeoR/GlpR family transcriptional regulator of sugar metabolism